MHCILTYVYNVGINFIITLIMIKKKNIWSFIREEDWKTIKKSMLVSSLGLIVWFWVAVADAWHTNSHWSATDTACHNSTHSSHSSY